MNITIFFLLTASNAFSESVGILHSLLCSSKDEEVRIKPILQEIINKEKKLVLVIDSNKVNEFINRVHKDFPADGNAFTSYTFLKIGDNRPIGNIMAEIRMRKRADSGLSDLEEIKEEFTKNGFHKIRHQSVAHKNKYLDKPASAPAGTIYPKFIEKLDAIMKKLRINCSIWFDYAFTNPYVTTIKSLEATIARTIGNKS